VATKLKPAKRDKMMSHNGIENIRPRYTSPQKREPLSEQEIYDIRDILAQPEQTEPVAKGKEPYDWEDYEYIWLY